jgi:hypothetical protein
VADLGAFFRAYDENWYGEHVAPPGRHSHREDAQRGRR